MITSFSSSKQLGQGPMLPNEERLSLSLLHAALRWLTSLLAWMSVLDFSFLSPPFVQRLI